MHPILKLVDLGEKRRDRKRQLLKRKKETKLLPINTSTKYIDIHAYILVCKKKNSKFNKNESII
jgi:hypothetical protein